MKNNLSVSEVWKVYPLNLCYSVSNLSRIKRNSYLKIFHKKSKTGLIFSVKRTFKERLLKLSIHRKNPDNQNTEYYIASDLGLAHRVIGITWIDNPFNLPEINHKDGNGLNIEISNLEWVTSSDNQKHAYKLGLRKPNRLINKQTGRYEKRK